MATKRYLTMWYDPVCCKTVTDVVEAENLPEAKHKAFQRMCDLCGDSIHKLTIYEERYVFDCDGERNPKPTAAFTEFAKRDYYTGMKIRRGGKDNG